jgi:ribosomal protein S19E (S16A)
MDEEAYLALEAIGRSASAGLAVHEHWIKAFEAIRWVIRTEDGLALTPAGRQARDEMASRPVEQDHPVHRPELRDLSPDSEP